MKTSKQLKILAGVTRVRIHLGMTQQMFAQYLGVSKSLISMVENGNRQLPAKAMMMICELENGLESTTESAEAMPQTIAASAANPANSWQQAELYVKQLRLQELQYDYARMNRRYEQLAKSLAHIGQLLNMPDHAASSRGRKILEFQLFKLGQQLKSCDYAARAKKEFQIGLLEQLIKGEEQTQEATTSNMELMPRLHLPKVAA